MFVIRMCDVYVAGCLHNVVFQNGLLQSMLLASCMRYRTEQAYASHRG